MNPLNETKTAGPTAAKLGLCVPFTKENTDLHSFCQHLEKLTISKIKVRFCTFGMSSLERVMSYLSISHGKHEHLGIL